MRMNIKMIPLLIVAVLMIAQMPVAAAAEEQLPHVCTAFTTTAVDEQFHTMTCSDCGEPVTEEHCFCNWKPQDADCHVRVCDCGASVTELHTWDEGVADEESGGIIYTCTLCSITNTKAFEPDEEETSTDKEDALAGDLDGDGQLSDKDMEIIRAISLGTHPSTTEQQRKAADVNHDGRVNGKDLVAVYMMLVCGDE